MGFSRFSFSLKPQQEITFVVEEEAFFTTSQLGTRDLQTFISKRSKELLEAKVIDQALIDVVIKIIKRTDVINALKSIINGSYSEFDLKKWVADLSGDEMIA